MREQRVCADFLDGRSRRLYLCRNVVPPYSPTHRSSMDNSSRLVARSPYASMDMNTELNSSCYRFFLHLNTGFCTYVPGCVRY